MSTANKSFLTQAWEFLGSMKLATILFSLLALLTFAGTLEQAHMSLYDVQAKYFESIVLVWWAGGKVPVPLLGGYLLLSVLFVNLLVGGVIRIRKNWRTAFVLVAHVGILSLLFGTFIEHQLSTKGQMTLFENDTESEFQSVYEWEVLVTAPNGDGEREYVIPWESFRDLSAGERVVWKHPDLPFEVAISDVARNGQPQPAKPGDEHAIDGFILARLKPVGIGGRVNIPALMATLHPTDGSKAQRSILWGFQDQPWDPTIGDTRYFVDLRRRTWDIPFAIRLDKFEHEMHPGTGMAKRYSSFVTKIDGATQEPIHITMNEPLRWRGYTFYQSDYGPKPNDPPGTPAYSTLSVVNNPSDQWPKWMLYFVITPALFVHFLIKLAKWFSAENSRNRRRRLSTAAMMLLALSLTGCDYTVGKHGGWSDDIQKATASVPVQSEGRVKPLHTWAAFGLLGMNHKRSCEDADGEKIKPVEWFLDIAFRPERAKTHQCFAVQTSGALKAVGAGEAAKKKRDRYSYSEIVLSDDVLARVSQLATQYREIEAKERSPVQQGVVDLDNNLGFFEGVRTLFDWARADYPIENPELQGLFDGQAAVRFTDILERSPDLIALARAGMGTDPDGKDTTKKAQDIGDLLMTAFTRVERSMRVGLFPPSGDSKRDEATWLTMRDVAGFALLRGQIDPLHLKALRGIEAMARAGDDGEAFLAGATAWRDASRELAEERDEYQEVSRELHFYGQAPFDSSMGWYGLAILAALVMLFLPRLHWMPWVVWGMTFLGLVFQTYGIVLRCLIRGRPPVSTLYETVIFIGASGVVALMAVEALTRRRIALTLAPILGLGLLLLAGRYEILTGTDTMPQLVAVLDTNYWLTLHVICISLGYMGGLAAALVAHVYVFGKLFRGDALPAAWYRDVVKIVYGLICFGLFTSLVGTILGGVWANDSWGRFWGWDPKENGALLICLAQLAILHARIGGLIKALGICLATIFQGMLVAFSWWGVNLLGIGLHSYGFTSGIFNALMTFYAFEGAVLLLGFYVALKDRMPDAPTRAAPPPQAEGSISS